MRIGLVVDSACDLPLSFFRDNDIEIMPISLRFGTQRYVDVRDPRATVEFYGRFIREHGEDAETEPFSVEGIRDLFLDRLVTRFDRVLVITVSSTRSEIFDNATKASFAVLKDYRERRRAAGLDGNFMLRVVDSGQLFTGEGVLVWELVRKLLQEPDIQFDTLRRHAEQFKRHVFAYAVPHDLNYLRARGRGDQSVGRLQLRLGSLFDLKPVVEAHNGETRSIVKVRRFKAAVVQVMQRAIERIEKHRLLAPVVVMSYAGDPAQIRSFAAYARLRRRAEEAQVTLLESPMSTTAGVYLGAGAFSLGYAAQS